MSRARKIALMALVATLGLPLAVLLSALGWLSTPAGNDLVRRELQALVTGLMAEGRLEIDQLALRPTRGLTAGGLRLMDGEDRVVIGVEALELRYSPGALLTERALVVDRLALRGPAVDLVVDEAGRLDLSRMFPSEETDEPSSAELPLKVHIRELALSGGAASYRTPEARWAAGDLALRASAQGEGSTLALDHLLLSGALLAPEAGALGLSASAVWDGADLELHDLDLRLGEGLRLRASGRGQDLTGEAAGLSVRLGIETLDLDALEPLSGDLGLKGLVMGTVAAEGPLKALTVRPELRLDEGRVEGALTLDLAAERLAWSAALDLDGVDLTALVDAVTEPTVLSGRVEASGAGTAWPEDVEVDGTLRLADAVTWGYAVPEAEAQVSVREGRARVTGLRYAKGRLWASGDGLLTDAGVDLDLVVRAADLGELDDFGVSGLEGDATLRGRLRVDWSADPVVASLEGRVGGDALGMVGVFNAAAWSTPLTLRWDGATFVTGEAELTAVLAYGVALERLAGPWTVEVDADGATRWDLPALTLAGVEAAGARVALGQAEVRGGLDAAGELHTEVLLEAADLSWERLGADYAVGAVRLRGDALGLDLELLDGQTSALALAGEADLASAAWRFDALRLGAPGEGWAAREPVAFVLGEAGLVDARVALASREGRVEVEGTLGLEGPLDARVEVEGFDLAWLAPVLPPSAEGLEGRVGLALDLRGEANDARITGRLRAQGLSAPDLAEGLDLDVDLGLAEGDLRFDLDLQAGGQDLGALRGRLPVGRDLAALALDPRQAASLELLVYPAELGALAAALPALGELPPGRVAAHLRAEGPLVDPDLALDLGLHLPAGEPATWLRADLSLGLVDGQLTLSGAGWEGGQRRLDLQGQAVSAAHDVLTWVFEGGPEPDLGAPGTWLGELSVGIVPLSVPLESLSGFVDLPEGLRGRVSGALVLAGELSAPTLGGALQLTDAALGEVVLAPAILALEPRDGGFGVWGSMGFSEEGEALARHSLDVQGFVPFTVSLDEGYDLDAELAREGLSLTVTGSGVPFAVMSVVDPAIQDGEGVVQVTGGVTGSLADPRPDLALRLEDGAFVYKDLGVAFMDLDLNARLRASGLEVGRLAFRTTPQRNVVEQTMSVITVRDQGVAREGCGAAFSPPLRSGEVRVSGHFGLEDLSPGAVDFDICGYEAYFSSTPDLLVQVSADMKMQGPWPAVAVTGAVRADDVVYVMDEADFFSGGGLALDPALHVLRSDAALAAARVEAPPPFYWPFDIQLQVDLARRATLDVTVPMLDTYDALGLSTLKLEDAVLDGVVDLRMFQDELAMVGEVSTRRGTVTVMNEAFELSDESTITFSGGDVTNPSLDITATHDAGSYGDIQVRITQLALTPDIEFVSDAGYSVTDVLSILLLGRPTTDLGQAGGGALGDISAFLASQASGAVADQFEVFGGGSLVDSFQLASEDARVLSSVKVGSTVGDRTYIELEINRDPEDDEGPTELTLEYVLTRRLEAALHVGGESSADLYANWRF